MIDNIQVKEIANRYEYTIKRKPNSSMVKAVGILLQRIIEDAGRMQTMQFKMQALMKMKGLDSRGL